LIIWIYL